MVVIGSDMLVAMQSCKHYDLLRSKKQIYHAERILTLPTPSFVSQDLCLNL